MPHEYINHVLLPLIHSFLIICLTRAQRVGGATATTSRQWRRQEDHRGAQRDHRVGNASSELARREVRSGGRRRWLLLRRDAVSEFAVTRSEKGGVASDESW